MTKQAIGFIGLGDRGSISHCGDLGMGQMDLPVLDAHRAKDWHDLGPRMAELCPAEL